jgi:hypothetical protein
MPTNPEIIASVALHDTSSAKGMSPKSSLSLAQK